MNIGLDAAPAPAPGATSTDKSRTRRKYLLFLAVNFAMLALILLALATNKHADWRTGLYVETLFLICTLPLIFVSSYRGRASLLIIFLAYYFATFALKDLSDLLSGKPPALIHSGSLFTGGELAILLGVLCYIIGYLTALVLLPRQSAGAMTRLVTQGD